MAHKPEKLLADIIAAGGAVQAFVGGRSRDEYDHDLMLRSAVERQFEILGEALRRLELLDAELVARISEHRRIVDFRNIIAHGYDSLDSNIVWQAIVDKLPVLIAEAEALLTEIAGGE